MNILFLNWKDIHNPESGGAELIIYELGSRLVRDGHTVSWFARSFAGCKPQEDVDGIRIIRRGNKLSVYWEAFAYYRSLETKPDRVIDCINTLCWQTPLYVPADRRFAYVNQLAREVFYYELPPVIGHIGYAVEGLQYYTYRNTPFVCYSKSVKNDIQSLGIAPSHIRTFTLGIEHGKYRRGKKSKSPLFVFIGRLVRMKRADLCIDAMKLVHRTYPDARLVIIGSGPQEEALKHQIAASALSGVVTLITHASKLLERHTQGDKVSWMQKAWAVVMPSVKEGWGMVVTEAAACGTPAIVTSVTGLSDSVIDGKTGTILPASPTADELARAMIDYIEHPDKRTSHAKNAHARSKQFTWEQSYETFLNHIARK